MSATMADLDMTPHACVCDACRGMCLVRPCWPTPDEANQLITAGWTDHLMADRFVTEDGGDLWLLCPAAVGHERGYAPSFGWAGCPRPKRCALLTAEEYLCPLHDLGLKPLEGRLAIHGSKQNSHWAIGCSWDTPEAQTLALGWMADAGLDPAAQHCIRCGEITTVELCPPCDAALDAEIDASVSVGSGKALLPLTRDRR